MVNQYFSELQSLNHRELIVTVILTQEMNCQRNNNKPTGIENKMREKTNAHSIQFSQQP